MKKVFLALMAGLFSIQCLAETSLWRISKGEQQLYLAGTIHMLSQDDLPFPAAFDQAYGQADKVVLETDMKALLDPQIQVRLMAQLSYHDGRLLPQLISPELYAELNQYLESRGMIPHMFIAMKPAGVMVTMLALEFQRLGIAQAGADTVYYERAVMDGKSVAGLETIDQHLSFLAAMGEGNEERFLRQTLIDIEKTESMMQDMVRYWKSGNVAGLEREVLDEMKDNYPQVYQSLLVDRNNRWLPQIRTMLETPEVEMILVGAAHLIGPDGILKALREQGYQVEQQ